MRIIFVVMLLSIFSILVVKYVDNDFGSGVPLATPATAADL